MLPKRALAFCDLASAKRDNGRGFFYAAMVLRRGVDFGRPVLWPFCFSLGFWVRERHRKTLFKHQFEPGICSAKSVLRNENLFLNVASQLLPA